MDLVDKLTILADSAKYDAACTSSGADRPGKTAAAGICHSFAADGRCISLLKVLMTNVCIYDCKYCVNRASNSCRRAAFTPEELAELTMAFYRRNYIEGLFLSSGVIRSPDDTMEQMIGALQLLRYRHNFWGYIHAKTIPGASPQLVRRLGLLADRISINVELPSEQSLRLLAPNKKREAIFSPMKQICEETKQNRQELAVYKNAEKFAPAGQATQMIIGASPETDYQIVTLAEAMYGKYALKARLLLGLYPRGGGRAPARARREAAAPARAPPLPGGLADAPVRLRSGGNPESRGTELQPLPRPEMQLGSSIIYSISLWT